MLDGINNKYPNVHMERHVLGRIVHIDILTYLLGMNVMKLIREYKIVCACRNSAPTRMYDIINMFAISSYNYTGNQRFANLFWQDCAHMVINV